MGLEHCWKRSAPDSWEISCARPPPPHHPLPFVSTSCIEILHSAVLETQVFRHVGWETGRGGKELNKHVLASQINLLQKFRVKNNFDFDEMDESLEEKRRKRDHLHLKADFELCCH